MDAMINFISEHRALVIFLVASVVLTLALCVGLDITNADTCTLGLKSRGKILCANREMATHYIGYNIRYNNDCSVLSFVERRTHNYIEVSDYTVCFRSK